MGRRLDERELRRRAVESVRERSFFNSVFYSDPATLSAEIDALGGAYESAGVDAWVEPGPIDGFCDFGFLEMWELRR
jgi:hypothetical protein